ncbi:uncharacterized protein BROUX77_005126 [Berkeleyomyces rouxiae]|uniref:uncharacterized protein n=1 Tax=Berkeleyomyces rouxiae TaxID=2035830 RepID=UPI003B7ED1EE
MAALNQAPVRVTGPELLHHLVLGNGAHDDKTAIEALLKDNRKIFISYAELDHLSALLRDQILEHLAEHAVGPDSRQPVIPILLPQCPELYIAQLAVLRAGGAFCPLNMDTPPDRLDFILEDVDASVMIVPAGESPRWTSEVLNLTVELSELRERVAEASSSQLDRSDVVTHTDSLSYVMYTSGSTGVPKGVGVSHRAATQSLLAHNRHIPPFSRFLQFAAPTFDVSVFEIFFPLFRRGTLVNAYRPAMLDDLPGVICRLDIDACELTPSVAGSLLVRRENAPGLKLLLTIGEMLTERVISEFGGSESQKSILWAMYGPTEAAIHCTLAPALPASASPNSIGFPLDSVSCFVIAEEGPFRVLEVGDIGELAIGGYQLADGYINRAEQTGAAFIETPLGLLYRSGDRARMCSNGTLECVGRICEGQVKLRGQRMELGEIEHAALRFEGCHGAVAAVINQTLVLFCAMTDNSGADKVGKDKVSADVAAECKRWLPAYMLPGDIVTMSSFPRLASGKVDRKHLKADYIAGMARDMSGTEEPTLDELQRYIMSHIEDLVGGRVQTNMTLASAGIDSLVALRLAARLRQNELEIHAMDILRAESILVVLSLSARPIPHQKSSTDVVADISLDVDNVIANSPDAGLERNHIEAALACASIQNAMLAETAKDSRAYCNRVSLVFAPGILAEQIQASFYSLMQLNASLRSGFVELSNGDFAQIIYHQKALEDVAMISDQTGSDGCQLDTSISPARPLKLHIGIPGHDGRLTVTMYIHHALYDGWSLDMLRADWSALLRSESVPHRPPFSIVTEFYARERPEETTAASIFWANQLNGWEPAALPHLSQWARPAHSGTICNVTNFNSLSKSELILAARAANCAPQTFFQTALAWLVSQMTATTSVSLGNVFSGRTLPIDRIESVIGPCLTSLPLHLDLSTIDTSADALHLVHSTERAVLDHLSMSLREVRRIAKAEAGVPLWNVLFAYQEVLTEAEFLMEETSHADFLESDILVEIQPIDDSFVCFITCKEAVLPREFAVMLAKQIEAVVSLLSKELALSMSDVPLRLDSNLLSAYNTAYKSLSAIPNVAVAFEQAVARAPNNEAVIFLAKPLQAGNTPDVKTLSYKDLNTSANQISRLIQCVLPASNSAGVVAIIMEKSPLLYKTILGVVKSGHAYLPILPSTPLARITTILEHAKVGLCLVDSMTLQQIGHSIGCQAINLEISDLSNFPQDSVWPQLDPDRPAYIIYTSGTTGAPKGVVATHLNLLSNVDTLKKIYPVTNGSRLLQACSQAFDVSVFEIFWAWICGLPLCTGTNATLFEDLEGAIRTLKVTHLSLTPTVASLIQRDAVPGVKFLVTAGEPMTESLYQEWVTDGALFQGYGPSETTNICTVKNMTSGEHISHLGFSFANTSAFVMPPTSLVPLPIGAVGELVFGGDQITAGYLNAPELTAAKYQAHPTFGRLYRSGDLGRMLPDGSLMILGRIDGQLKVHGQRVDVGEINGIITGSYLGSSSVTILVKDGCLGSFYVSNYGEEMSDDHIAQRASVFSRLKTELPSYMVPVFLMPVPDIPLTPSGKVDRESLLKTFFCMSSDQVDRLSSPMSSESKLETVPWSANEMALAEAIANVLEVDVRRVGLWSPLASIGLDSFTAIRAAKRLSLQLGKKVTVASLFRYPTVAQLSKQIALECRQISPPPSFPNASPPCLADAFVTQMASEFAARGLRVETILPCLPLQTAMLASAHEDTYFCQTTLALKVPPEKARTLWSEVHLSRGILRTCFMPGPTPEMPFVQVCLSPQSDLLWLDSSPSVGACFSSLKQMLGAATGSFRPPLGFGVVREHGQDLLCFTMHHSLYDGTAIEVLFAEIDALARGIKLGTDVNYGTFLEKALCLPESTESFWKAHFEGFTPVCLSKEPVAAPRATSSILHHTLSIPLSKLEGRARDIGVSLLPIFQTAWAVSASLTLEIPDFCFGNIFAGRNVDLPDVDHLVAPCFNTLPLRVNFTKGNFLHALQLVKYFHNLNTNIMAYTFTPLRDIQRHISCGSGPGSVFDTMLLLQSHRTAHKNNMLWDFVTDDSEMDIPIVCEAQLFTDSNSVKILLHHDTLLVETTFATELLKLLDYMIERIVMLPSSGIPNWQSLPQSLQTSRKQAPATNCCRQSSALASEDSQPWSDLEMTVRSAFAVLSQVPEYKIKRFSTIYQLGLDSINAVQIASSLRLRGFSVSGVDVLECLTCAGLAQYISATIDSSAHKYDASSSSETALTPHSSPDMAPTTTHSASPLCEEIKLPCTPVQDAMIAEFVNTNGRAYFNHLVLQMDEGVTRDQVRNSLQGLVTSQPMLRAGFAPANLDTTSRSVNQMLIYPSILVPLHELETDLDIKTWKAKSARVALSDLSFPPWTAALFQNENGSLNLALAIHHALYDAASLKIMLSSFSTLLRGDYVPTSRISDAAERLESLHASSCISAEKKWKETGKTMVVNGFPVMTPLSMSSNQSLSLSRRLSPLPSEIKEAMGHVNASTQAFIQATWTRILAGYLGEDNVTFGVVLSGRSDPELENAPFPCVTTLPAVLCNVTNNRDLLCSAAESVMKLQRLEYSRLTDVQRWVGRPSMSLFDTLLVVQRDEGSDNFPWKTVQDEGTVHYPLSLEVGHNNTDGLVATLTFWDNVVPKEQAKLLLDQVDAIFSDLIRNPDGTRDDLWRENRDVMSILPAKVPEIPTRHRLLHEMVEGMAKKQPDATALEFVDDLEGDIIKSRLWTYQQLDNLGNVVAELLQPHTCTDSVVAVHFDKCPEAYFAILGILKAGCSFLALDPTAPSDRKKFILTDSQALLVLAGSSVPALETDIDVLILDVNHLMSLPVPKPRFSRPARPDTRSYCLYTSGTTGTPKGCELTHHNAVQGMKAFQHLFKGTITPSSRCLQFASFHFDVSVLEQYWTWSVGMTLIAAPRDLILADIEHALATLRISHVDLTPSLAAIVKPEKVPTLCNGVFITGGEQLRREILDSWGPLNVIYNAYGPTEATIGVTMRQRVPENGRPANIGPQFPNVGSFVLHPGTDIPVLRGAVGELCVSGPLVGKGYLGRPDLTQERFPTLKSFEERVYRTGDLVRVLHDGSFDFLGRADDQVKLRGQRLELGEISHAICTGVDQIKHAVCLVAKHRVTDKDLLVAFISEEAMSSARDTTVEREPCIIKTPFCELAKATCKAKLPIYMVPTYILGLSFIPLSPNNKAEVKQLRAIFSKLSPKDLVDMSKTTDLLSPTKVSSANSSQTEATILRALADISDLEHINRATSVFDCGVDSISVARFVRLLSKHGLTGVSAALVLENPTAVELSNAILRATSTSPVKVQAARQKLAACDHLFRSSVLSSLHIPTETLEYVAPCTPLQDGMISRAMVRGDGTYFNSFMLKLSSELDVMKLRGGWDYLIQNNPILRTVFVPTSTGYVQAALRTQSRCWNEISVPLETSLSDLSAEFQTKWIKANMPIISEPLKLTLLSMPSKKILLVQIFHGVYDGHSLDLMLAQIATHLNSQHGEKVPVSAPSFKEALCYGPLWEATDTRKFWTEHLSDWRPSLLSALSSFIPSSPAVKAQIILDCTPISLIQSGLSAPWSAVALSLCLSFLSSQLSDNVTTGIVTAGRTLDLDNTDFIIGPLFNTVPFHASLGGTKTWQDVLRQCQEFLNGLHKVQHTPLRDIQKWCSNGEPLFDSLFSYRTESNQNENTPWEEIEDYDPKANTDYAIAFEATKLPGNYMRILVIARPEVLFQTDLQNVLDNLAARLYDLKTHSLFSLSCSETPPTTTISSSSTRFSLQAPVSQSLSYTNILIEQLSTFSKIDISHIDASSSISNLGLDSIDVVRFSSHLRTTANIILAPFDIMKHATIQDMAFFLSSQANSPKAITKESSDWKSLVQRLSDCVRSNGLVDHLEAVLPATPLQETMVAKMLQSDFEYYFNHDLREVAAGVDILRLETAFQTLVRERPILRTCFVPISDASIDVSFAQVVKTGPLVIEHLELNLLDNVTKITSQARASAIVCEGSSPLFQVRFLTIKQKHYVLLSIAHALYDGWSLSLIHEDLISAYHNNLSARNGPEAFLQTLFNSQSRKASDFWDRYLSGAPSTLVAPSVGVSEASRVHHLELDSLVSGTLIRDFTKAHSISVQSLGLAVWSTVLSCITSSLDVVFGVVLAGRDLPGAQNIMFPTMNTVAIRAILHGSCLEFCKYLDASLHEMREFQAYPLRKAIVGALRVDKSIPLFNTLFLLQKTLDTQSDLPRLFHESSGEAQTEYPLSIELELASDRVMWRATTHSGSNIDDLLSTLDKTLALFVSQPEDDVVQLSALISPTQTSSPPFIEETFSTPTLEASLTLDSPYKDEVWTSAEATIRSVLAQVAGLSLQDVTKTSTIYTLGLDSITAIKVAAILKERGLNLTSRHLLVAHNIEAMAETAQLVPGIKTIEPPPQTSRPITLSVWNPDLVSVASQLRVPTSDVAAVLPCLPMQPYMLTACHQSRGSTFLSSFTYKLSGATTADLPAVKVAWETTVCSLPILRTVLIPNSSKQVPFMQVILTPSSAALDDTFRLHTLPGAAPSFDKHKPLVRASICISSDLTLTFALSIHHALYDANSLPAIIEVFMENIQKARNGVCEVIRVDMTPWKSLLFQPLLSIEQRKNFWTMKLCNITSSPGISPLNPEQRVESFYPALVQDLTATKRVCAREGISIQAFVFANFAQEVAAAQGQQDALFGVYMGNSGAFPMLHRTFPMLSLVPLHVSIASNESVVCTAKKIQIELHLLTDPVLSQTGLHEIHNWAGVSISRFFNFLSMPSSLPDTQAPIVATPCPLSANSDDNSRILLSRNIWQPVQDAFWPSPIVSAFQHSIDIEAAIRENHLDIGIFGALEIATDHKVQEMAEHIKIVMNGLC